jgi:hypothetical protein
MVTMMTLVLLLVLKKFHLPQPACQPFHWLTAKTSSHGSEGGTLRNDSMYYTDITNK